MESKQIGNIGEAMCLARFVELGVPIYLQFGDNEAADYLVIVNDEIFKIQVKASTTYDGAKVVFDLTTSTLHNGKHNKHKYSLKEVDYFCCYDTVMKEVYLIKNIGDMASIALRYVPSKNNQKDGVKFASDYVLSKELIDQMKH